MKSLRNLKSVSVLVAVGMFLSACGLDENKPLSQEMETVTVAGVSVTVPDAKTQTAQFARLLSAAAADKLGMPVKISSQARPAVRLQRATVNALPTEAINHFTPVASPPPTTNESGDGGDETNNEGPAVCPPAPVCPVPPPVPVICVSACASAVAFATANASGMGTATATCQSGESITADAFATSFASALASTLACAETCSDGTSSFSSSSFFQFEAGGAGGGEAELNP